MTVIVSVSHGDGDTIPEDLAEGYFPHNFKEYMQQLKWTRHTMESSGCSGWVFWSQQDPEIEPSLSLDKVEYKIRRVLGHMMSLNTSTMVGLFLVQFWAPLRTPEGRTRLRTQYQPFAVSHAWGMNQRQRLCEYRMKMCSSEYNNYFYADAESGEEQLGLPGRVFLHQLPECIPTVEVCSTKEYPQRELALRCHIRGSWAVPVFERSTCVGVLEMASLSTLNNYDWQAGYFLGDVQKKLEELGLQCFTGYPACEEECGKNKETVKEPAHVLKELKAQLCYVCEIHELPLAMAWVPCSGCKGLQRCEVWSGGVEFCVQGDIFLQKILEFSKYSHLRKGLVVKRERSSNMLYCSDITQLSLDDYPLVPYVRRCKLSGWFTICLEHKHNKNHVYILEFFLSARSKDDDIMTTLSFILGTMEKIFTTFRIASGKELGELMLFDVINFQNGQEFHSVKPIQATRDFSSDSDHLPSVQYSANSANKRPRFQDANMLTIKGKNVLNSDPVSDYDLSSYSDPVSDPFPFVHL